MLQGKMSQKATCNMPLFCVRSYDMELTLGMFEENKMNETKTENRKQRKIKLLSYFMLIAKNNFLYCNRILLLNPVFVSYDDYSITISDYYNILYIRIFPYRMSIY